MPNIYFDNSIRWHPGFNGSNLQTLSRTPGAQTIMAGNKCEEGMNKIISFFPSSLQFINNAPYVRQRVVASLTMHARHRVSSQFPGARLRHKHSVYGGSTWQHRRRRTWGSIHPPSLGPPPTWSKPSLRQGGFQAEEGRHHPLHRPNAPSLEGLASCCCCCSGTKQEIEKALNKGNKWERKKWEKYKVQD